MTISATIPVDVVGRTTIHDGEDFLLVGASDNGDTAPMVKWDSRNSRWIELEVSKKVRKMNEKIKLKVLFCRPNPRKLLGRLCSSTPNATLL